MSQAAFPCPFPDCTALCKRKADLARHERIHDPDRRAIEHKCPEPGCNTSMLQLHNLNVHIKSQHRGYKWECKYASCSSKFSDPGARTRHMKRYHGYLTRRQIRSAAAQLSQFDDLISLSGALPSLIPPDPFPTNTGSSYTSTTNVTGQMLEFGQAFETRNHILPQSDVFFNSPNWFGEPEEVKPGPSLTNVTTIHATQWTDHINWLNMNVSQQTQDVKPPDFFPIS